MCFKTYLVTLVYTSLFVTMFVKQELLSDSFSNNYLLISLRA